MAEKQDNRRIAYTKRVIREALFDLMKEKPLNKISVTELCAKADINRSTFYSYYEDIYDLHKKILREFFEDQHETIRNVYNICVESGKPTVITKDEIYRILLCIFSAAYKKKELYKFIYNSNATNNIHINTGKVLYRTLSPLLYNENTPLSRKMVFRKAFSFVNGGVTAMLINWLNKNCVEPPEEMAKLAAALCYGGLISEINEFNFDRKEN